MTQRIFDVENEKDMADLWDILPHNINRVVRHTDRTYELFEDENFLFKCGWLRINWHDKTEITRPIQEATEADIGKICVLWNDVKHIHYGVLAYIGHSREMPYYATNVVGGSIFNHCRRLTKQEIEEII